MSVKTTTNKKVNKNNITVTDHMGDKLVLSRTMDDRLRVSIKLAKRRPSYAMKVVDIKVDDAVELVDAINQWLADR